MVTTPNFLTPKSLQPDVVDLLYFIQWTMLGPIVKYLVSGFTPSGCKDIRIIKICFVIIAHLSFSSILQYEALGKQIKQITNEKGKILFDVPVIIKMTFIIQICVLYSCVWFRHFFLQLHLQRELIEIKEKKVFFRKITKLRMLCNWI